MEKLVCIECHAAPIAAWTLTGYDYVHRSVSDTVRIDLFCSSVCEARHMGRVE